MQINFNTRCSLCSHLSIVSLSGKWTGFFVQDGKRKNFTMHLSFSSSKDISGHCTDLAENSDHGRVADISGIWFTQDRVEEGEVNQKVVIQFKKRHWGKDPEEYEGFLTSDFKRITGVHSNFEIDFVSGDQLDTVWRCSQDSRRKAGGMCEFGCCNGCMEKYTVVHLKDRKYN